MKRYPHLSGLGISLLLFSFLLYTTSCKTTRSIAKKPLKEHGADYLFDKMKENQFQFKYLSAKFSLELINDDKKTSLKGQLRICRDSAIWISLSPALGIEAARILITNDTVKFMNRLNKTCFVGDNQLVTDFLNSNVDFDVIQALILGNDLTYYENGKFRATYDSKEYHIMTANRRKLKKYIETNEDKNRIFIQNIYLNPETFKITRMKIKEKVNENRKLEAVYDDFREVDGQLFPFSIKYKLTAGKPITVDIKYSRISTGKTLRFPFKIPSKYTPLKTAK